MGRKKAKTKERDLEQGQQGQTQKEVDHGKLETLKDGCSRGKKLLTASTEWGDG